MKQYLLLHMHITVPSLHQLGMQVRLYSLAGHLQQHESAFTGQPLVVQRLPSKLSSLAWDHNQNVGLLCVSLPVSSGALHDCIVSLNQEHVWGVCVRVCAGVIRVACNYYITIRHHVCVISLSYSGSSF